MENTISAFLFILPALSLLAMLFLYISLSDYLGIGSRPRFDDFVRETHQLLKKKSRQSLFYQLLMALWWIAWVSIGFGIIAFIYFTFTRK